MGLVTFRDNVSQGAALGFCIVPPSGLGRYGVQQYFALVQSTLKDIR